jgi:hypothetical protein
MNFVLIDLSLLALFVIFVSLFLYFNKKNFLNIWFRHIWFSIYPVSSAMILITSEKFSNIGIDALILADIPVFIATILIGYILLRRFTKNIPSEKEEVKKRFLEIANSTGNSIVKNWNYFRWLDSGQALILGLGTFFVFVLEKACRLNPEEIGFKASAFYLSRSFSAHPPLILYSYACFYSWR